MYWDYIVYSQYRGGLKWKPCYKKSRALASARVPPLLFTLTFSCLFAYILLTNHIRSFAFKSYQIHCLQIISDFLLTNHIRSFAYKSNKIFSCQIHSNQGRSRIREVCVAFLQFLAALKHSHALCLAEENSEAGEAPLLGKPSRKKSAVFLNIVQKAFDPPPFIWTFVLFCRGCFLNVFYI